MMTWHVIPHHINLDLIYPCYNFKIRNYLVQHVTILKTIKKHFTKNVLIN
jgi:hypothetical protein